MLTTARNMQLDPSKIFYVDDTVGTGPYTIVDTTGDGKTIVMYDIVLQASIGQGSTDSPAVLDIVVIDPDDFSIKYAFAVVQVAKITEGGLTRLSLGARTVKGGLNVVAQWRFPPDPFFFTLSLTWMQGGQGQLPGV